VLRRIQGPKRYEVTGGCRKMHIKDHHSFYSSPNTIRIIKSKWVRQAGLVAHLREMRNAYNIWLQSLKVTDHPEDLIIDDSIMLKWILKK
jgi:hypothetical protein